MRTLQEPICVMQERGRAGVRGVLWEHSMTQASLIFNVTHQRWGAADENETPHERKTGKQHTLVSQFRLMFCLAYARCPAVLQGRKLEPHADNCVHLGTSPNKPGYRLEVL
eukprot:6183544-Pleurochrysis_carterae.AAC.2